jgi:hypothetical protein
MAGSCLHCLIHEVIQAHARETEQPRADGRQPISGPLVLKALGAVTAEVIAGGEDEAAISAALGTFMSSLIFGLARHGVNATISVADVIDNPVDDVRLH